MAENVFLNWTENTSQSKQISISSVAPLIEQL